jgi:hypothetical protein
MLTEPSILDLASVKIRLRLFMGKMKKSIPQNLLLPALNSLGRSQLKIFEN